MLRNVKSFFGYSVLGSYACHDNIFETGFDVIGVEASAARPFLGVDLL